MRYKVTGEWTTERVYHLAAEDANVELQSADITDTKDGHVYRDGAYRVQVDGKSIKGKGGTTPYFGESAWSDGQRKYHDIINDIRFGRRAS